MGFAGIDNLVPSGGAGDLLQSIQVGETRSPRLWVASRRANPIVKSRTSIPALMRG
jgi:hypothetical protein